MKRVLSIILALAMAVSCFAMVNILAADEPVLAAKITGKTDGGTSSMPNTVMTGYAAFSGLSFGEGETSKSVTVKLANEASQGLYISVTLLNKSWGEIISTQKSYVAKGDVGSFVFNVPKSNGDQQYTAYLLRYDFYTAKDYNSACAYTLVRDADTDAFYVWSDDCATVASNVVNDSRKGQHHNSSAITSVNELPESVKIEQSAETAVGVEVKAEKDNASTYIYTATGGGALVGETPADGKIKKTYTVYNPNSTDITVTMLYQASVRNAADTSTTWAGFYSTKTTIPANQKAELTVEIPVEADNNSVKIVSSTVKDGQQTTTLDKLFLRFDITGLSKKDAAFIVAAPEGDKVYGLASATNFIVTKVFALPAVQEPGSDGGEGDGEQDTRIPVGVEVLASEDKERDAYVKTAAGVFTNDDVKDGRLSVTYTVYNTSEKEFTVSMGLQAAVRNAADTNNTWAGFSKSVKLAAGAKTDITLDVPVTDGKIAIESTSVKDGKQEVTVDKIFLRFDILKDGKAGVEKDSKFVVAAEKDDRVYSLAGTVYTITPVYELPAEDAADGDTVAEKPTAVTFTATVDTDKATYFKTADNVITAADIKDGVITKKLTVKNEGTEDIKAYLTLQAAITKDGKTTWKAPSGGNGEKVDILAGETVELVYEVDTENGKVTVDGQEIDIAKLFYRLDLYNADGGNAFKKGTSITVFCEDNDNAVFSAVSFKDWSTTVRTNYYATGDVLPAAMIAIVAAAAVALAAVAKKRKED